MIDQNFNKTWEDLNTLNEEQQQPTKNYKGPQFVVACPGAGK